MNIKRKRRKIYWEKRKRKHKMETIKGKERKKKRMRLKSNNKGNYKRGERK